MDFSKWRKIFYIVAIISMILSIKSKVLGAYYPSYQNVTFDITDTFISENPYYLIAVSDEEINGSYYAYVCRSNSPITADSSKNTAYSFKFFNLQGTGITSSWGTLSGMSAMFTNNSFSVIPNSNIPTESSSITILNNIPYTILFSNYDIIDTHTNEVIHSSNAVSYPSFDNVTEIENGNPDGVYISPADFSNTDNLYFHLLQINTGLSNSDQSIYYYSDKTFILNKDSDYYRTWADPSIEGFYYYIPRYKLGLSQNTSYLYVLNNSKNQIQNSQGIYEEDASNGVYDVLESDTAGVISATEEQSNRLHNIEVQQQEALKDQKNFQDTFTDTNIQNTTENDVDTSLNYSSDNQQLNNVFTGFFSRLSTWLSQFLDYDITQDTTLNIPIPHSEETITLHSNILYNQLHNTALYPIIYTFYMFIFMTNLVLFYTKVYATLVTGGYLNSLKNPITDSGIDKTIL